MVTTLDEVFRQEWGRVVATLIGLLGDVDLAEESAQRAQGERDLRLDRQRRVAAGEDQLQALVRERRGGHRYLHGQV